MPTPFRTGIATEIPIKDWAPDLDPTSPGILLDTNVVEPTLKGFKARNSAVQYAPALPAKPMGAYIAQYASGATSILAGTAAHLYRLIAGVWTVVDTTGPFAVTHPWQFAQFADDVIAVNPDVTAPQVAAGIAGTFAALGGSPPSNPTTVISVAGFAAMYNANEWFNSSAGTDTGWTPNVQTQSASGFLYDFPGNIVAAAPFFRQQVLWKLNSMYLLTYIGGTLVWQSQIMSGSTGTWGQGCVIQMPEAIAFLGTDDFYISQGYAPTRIPNNIKEFFFANVAKDANGFPTQLQNTLSWYDPINAVAYWHYVSNVAPFAGVPDQYVSWNTRANRWGHGYLSTPWVIGNTQSTLLNGFYFDTNNVLQTWSGTPTTMFLLSGYLGEPGHLTQVQKIRAKYTPGFYPTSETLIPMSTPILGKPDIVYPAAILGQNDWFNTRVTDRYIRAQLNTVGACEVSAMAYEARQAGRR